MGTMNVELTHTNIPEEKQRSRMLSRYREDTENLLARFITMDELIKEKRRGKLLRS